MSGSDGWGNMESGWGTLIDGYHGVLDADTSVLLEGLKEVLVDF